MQTPMLSLAPPSAGLEDLIEKARSYIHAAKSPATLRAYRTDFEDFTRFCEAHNLPHLPATPTTVALYIADRAGSLRAATITRRLTSITKAHQAAGCEASPICAARRSTRRPRDARSAFPWGAMPPPARSAHCAIGSGVPASSTEPSFAGSTAMAGPRAAVFTRTVWAGS